MLVSGVPHSSSAWTQFSILFHRSLLLKTPISSCQKTYRCETPVVISHLDPILLLLLGTSTWIPSTSRQGNQIGCNVLGLFIAPPSSPGPNSWRHFWSLTCPRLSLWPSIHQFVLRTGQSLPFRSYSLPLSPTGVYGCNNLLNVLCSERPRGVLTKLPLGQGLRGQKSHLVLQDDVCVGGGRWGEGWRPVQQNV